MSTKTNKKWNKFDTAWVLNLFGTAVGAGDFSRTDDIFCASWLGLFRVVFF